MSRRILIAGGAGFIGTNLTKYLLARNDQVFCVDNLSTGFSENLAPFMEHSKFAFIEQDISTPLDLEVDEIYNLACPASPDSYQSDPIQTIKASVMGTLQLADLAVRQDAKFLQASTSEVYGNPLVHPQPETYFGNVDPTGPRSCYDEGKRCAETILFDYHRMQGLKIKVARLFNVYGPHLHHSDGRVVRRFIAQALSGGPLSVFGDGTQTRSFCFVDDLIVALTGLMEAQDDFTGPINLGNPEEITILDLAQIILERTASKSDISFEPLPKDDPIRRCPDITLAKQVLSWQPETSIQAGIDQTIAWYRAEQTAP